MVQLFDHSQAVIDTYAAFPGKPPATAEVDKTAPHLKLAAGYLHLQ